MCWPLDPVDHVDPHHGKHPTCRKVWETRVAWNTRVAGMTRVAWETRVAGETRVEWETRARQDAKTFSNIIHVQV